MPQTPHDEPHHDPAGEPPRNGHGSPSPAGDWVRALEDLAERGGSLTLRVPRAARGVDDESKDSERESEAQGSAHRFELPLLGVDAGGLLVGWPETAWIKPLLRAGAHVEVMLLDGESRWVGRTHVREAVHPSPSSSSSEAGVEPGSAEPFDPLKQLGLDQEPVAVQLAPLRRMHDERRRVEARVPTGGGTAMLTPWHTPGAAPFAARLLNVSLGGLGLEVESESAQGLQIGGELVCRLDLRWLNLGQLRLSCRLVHRRDQGQGLSYLGLAIREPSGGESRRWLDCVERLHDAHRFNGVDRSKQIDPTQSDGAQA